MKYPYICIMLVMPLVGMVDLKKNIKLMEEQIKTIDATGNRLLSTGKQLHDELIKKIDVNQKNISAAIDALQLPTDILVRPIVTLQAVVNKEIKVDILKKPILFLLDDQNIQSGLRAILELYLENMHFQKLPDLMVHLNDVLSVMNRAMIHIHEQFYPFVLELHSFVDINQAKKDLKLSSTAFNSVTLEFVSTYPEYVEKIYAQHTNGGQFDQKGIYKNLAKTKKYFASALQQLQKLLTLLEDLGGE